jgi:hypothetical protein
VLSYSSMHYPLDFPCSWFQFFFLLTKRLERNQKLPSVENDGAQHPAMPYYVLTLAGVTPCPPLHSAHPRTRLHSPCCFIPLLQICLPHPKHHAVIAWRPWTHSSSIYVLLLGIAIFIHVPCFISFCCIWFVFSLFSIPLDPSECKIFIDPQLCGLPRCHNENICGRLATWDRREHPIKKYNLRWPVKVP